MTNDTPQPRPRAQRRTTATAQTDQTAATRRAFLATAVGTAGFAAGGASVAAAQDDTAQDDPDRELTAVALDLSYLPDLPEGAYYEGWAVSDDAAVPNRVSTGVFAPGDEYAFEVGADLSRFTEIAITIESDDEPGGEPSGVVVLAGTLEDGVADLSFPIDLETDTGPGSFRLATPTAPDAPDTSGVWFLSELVGTSTKIDSLDLPAIETDGWTYEGWVVHEGTPLSTGRFDDPAAADGASPYSGDVDGPDFPGEDFVQNAPDDFAFPTDLVDGRTAVVVSVEPDLDGEDPTGSEPFDLTPRVGEIPANAEAGTNYSLEVTDGAAPTGTATLHGDLDAARDALEAPVTEFQLALSKLPALGDDAQYEAWVRFEDGDTVSAGVLSPDGDHSFAVGRDLATAEWIGVSIEPDGVPGGDPDSTLVLDGEFDDDGTAELSFPQSLADVSGSYRLATPTAPNAAPESGVWFLEPADGRGQDPSLDLSSTFLPDGWTYEGWIVHEGVTLSTGRFYDPVVSDDASTYAADAEAAPAFPGEDLVANAPDGLAFPTDLTDGESTVVVSIEPELHDRDPTGDGPFQLTPLVGEIPADAEPRTNYDMDRTLESFPTGTAVLDGADSAAVLGDGHLVRDVDGDGSYRDVTGDGAVTNTDITEFFANQHADPWNSRPDLFDFDGDDEVGQSDVIELFEHVNADAPR